MIASDLMRRMVNDYLPEKESFMEECRSDYNVHQSDDMPDSSEDSSIGRSAIPLKILFYFFELHIVAVFIG